jgi:hypothetical protein
MQAYLTYIHRCMYGKGWPTELGLPKVSIGPAMFDPSMLCGRATPETALRPFQGMTSRRPGGLRPSSTPLNSPWRTPMVTFQEKY